MKENKVNWRWGLTLVVSACAILVFYNTFFQNGVLLLFIRRLFRILTPVIYGVALAYLLAPIVNYFDGILSGGERAKKTGLVRGVSILLTWLVVAAVIYVLIRIIGPELYRSVITLGNNMSGYYWTIYGWVTQLLENNPSISEWVTTNIQEYYRELVAWVTNTWVPQAQQTIALVTGGLLSVLNFFKDFLVGIAVSVYLLARKERSAVHAKRMLYSFTKEPTYEGVLRATRKIDEIFSGFVRGKLLDSLIIGILCFIGASILRLPYAPLVSVIVGVTNIIPFFGPFLGAIPSALLILLDSPIKCLYFIIFVLVLQQFDGNILGPKILGSSTNLSSFWVIVAILIGGGFGGVLGMFLGVPLFACAYAAVNYWSEKRLARRGKQNFDPDGGKEPPEEITAPTVPSDQQKQ